MGIYGNRSGLWFEMFRAIRILRPRFAIIENVSAITFRGLDRVLANLAEIGYDAEWQNIRASDMGAPHRRERIWIVAYPNSFGLQGEWEECSTKGQVRFCSGEGCNEKQNISDTRDDRIIEWVRELPEDKSIGEGGHNNRRRAEIDACREWWKIEPAVGRVVNELPSRLDRLKCLGNSIVPQIAELLFLQIKEFI